MRAEKEQPFSREWWMELSKMFSALAIGIFIGTLVPYPIFSIGLPFLVLAFAFAVVATWPHMRGRSE